MAKIQSWEVSESFWESVKLLIPEPERDPNKAYKRKPGGGRVTGANRHNVTQLELILEEIIIPRPNDIE